MSRTLERLHSRFRGREEVGLLKYGTSIDRQDLSGEAWLAHLHEELMDGCLYLERLRGAYLLIEEARRFIEASEERNRFPKSARKWLDKYQEQFGGEE